MSSIYLNAFRTTISPAVGAGRFPVLVRTQVHTAVTSVLARAAARALGLESVSVLISYTIHPARLARVLWNTCQYSWATLHSRSISLKHVSIFMSYNTRLARVLWSTCRYHQAGSSSLKHVSISRGILHSWETKALQAYCSVYKLFLDNLHSGKKNHKWRDKICNN